jgi:hypothetical protein
VEPNPAAQPAICPQCHIQVDPSWYFCANCGKQLNAPPLPTDIGTQIWIYAFSIILPMICFIAVTKWPGLKYYRSQDPKAKMIGTVAWVLIVLSTVVLCWLAYVWTEEAIQSTQASINADMSI